MIIMIILGSIVAIGIALIIWFAFTDEDCLMGSIIFTGFFAFAFIMCGVICITKNSHSSIASKEYSLKETINKFAWDKQILESYHLVVESEKTTFTSDITLEKISTENYYKMVNEYNDEVFKFKCDVVARRFERDNLWISWFINPAYKSITDEMLNELTYTIGK